ncbi:MAG TPA: winged helix-turn-helix domain-containing protein [Steroidobacteraceae bacterium]|jgi:two-component system phosphate regulon response regulator PhoB
MLAEARKQILIVDRDVATVDPLRQRLAEGGFIVSAVTDVSLAMSAVATRPPHLLIVDWNVPGFALDIIERVRKARAPQPVRLVILSSLTGEDHVVTALNLGADDYITKPFSLREVSARIMVLMRGHPHLSQPSSISFDNLVLDAATNRVTAQGTLMNLRGVEYRLLEFLMSHSGKTFNRNQLLSHVWGDDCDVDERTVDVNVQRLRKILGTCGYEAYIQTVRGFGYRFAPPTATIG